MGEEWCGTQDNVCRNRGGGGGLEGTGRKIMVFRDGWKLQEVEQTIQQFCIIFHSKFQQSTKRV